MTPTRGKDPGRTRPPRVAAALCLFALASACAPPVKSMKIENATDGFQWHWNEEVQGMEGSVSFEVRDQLDRPVSDLGAENFSFFQDGGPADRESLATSTDLRLSMSLVLDTSASLREAQAERAVLSAAVRFVGTLHEKATFRYYGFATDVEELNDLSQVEFDGRFTSLYDAVYMAAKNAVRRGEARTVVVFTDGRDNRSATSLDELTAYLAEERVSVFAVGMGDVDTAALEAMASAHGGRSIVAYNTAALPRAFRDVAAQLGGLYRVSYISPSRPGPDEHELRFHIQRKRVGVDLLDQFVVDRNRTRRECGPGMHLAAHSDFLCCPDGSQQSPGSFTCGSCGEVNGSVTTLVPGTATCKSPYVSIPTRERSAVDAILERRHVRQWEPPPEPGGVTPLQTFSALGAAGPAQAQPVPGDGRMLGVELAPALLGLQVTRVLEGTPAEAAGIQVGDLLVTIDDQPLASISVLQQAIAAKHGTFAVGLLRAGEPVLLTAEIP